jgi:methyltransferase-like protein/2-polyprenyl-3-methyl-5-hydroxy-6-metoxy-1,4-benzoquinol methylase
MAQKKSSSINSAPGSFSTSYDELPYESYPFAHTRPEHLRTIGLLFGMNPPKIEKARILELGSASGGNLINFASTYPNSYSLGVDLSKVEIDHGIKRIKDLGLNNIELKAMSITDLDDSVGKFDYIICHGVFSWVPEFVRDQILEVSKNFLVPNGIAFVSYNTLPGWNMVNNIRDMMMFHADLFHDTQSKLQQSRLFLKFVTESLENSPTPYAKFLKENAESLMKYEDSYIRHEYLSEDNTQFYFHEFMDIAKSKGLAYLGESNFHTMFIGNLPQKAAEKLADIQDIVRTEQYMDFIKNTRFRCTLLCHDNVQLNRAISIESLDKFYMTVNLTPEKVLSEEDIKNSFETVKFYYNNMAENFISTSSPIMKAIFCVLADNVGNPLKSEEFLKQAQKKLPDIALADFQTEFAQNIGKLVFGGYFKIFADKPKFAYEISDRPKVTDLARYQAEHCAIPDRAWTISQVNEIIILQTYAQHIIKLLDGNHSISEIKEAIVQKFQSGELVASDGDQKVSDAKVLKDVANQVVDTTLQSYKRNYLLIG